MRYNRASPKDKLSEVRTKLPDRDYDALCRLADSELITVYALVRSIIQSALAERARQIEGLPKSAEAADFGTIRGERPIPQETVGATHGEGSEI